jgi:hypothetical protein
VLVHLGMRVITPAILFAAFIVGCLDEEPPRPRPQPTDDSGKADNGDLVPLDEAPLPDEDDGCGGDQKRADGDCLPPAE